MPIVRIPNVGPVRFPEGTADEVIDAAAKKLYDRAGLDAQMSSARRTGAIAEGVANAADWGSFLLEPLASTAEHPLGLIQTGLLQPLGQVINEASDAAKEMY